MASFQDPSHDDRQPGAVPPQQSHPADIRVTRDAGAVPPAAAPRRRGGPWLWLLPLLLLFAVGIALTRGRRGAEPEVAALDPAGTSVAAGGEVVGDGAGANAGANAVGQFVTWANQGGNTVLPQESEENHPYTSQGIRLLADALGAASAGQAGDHATTVARIREQATLLQASSGDDKHAEYAHAAFMDAARVLGELRGGDVRNELTAAAARVQPGRPLSPQGEQVRAFFRAAAAAMPGATR